jgi:AraC-like DNA-binding protein
MTAAATAVDRRGHARLACAIEVAPVVEPRPMSFSARILEVAREEGMDAAPLLRPRQGGAQRPDLPLPVPVQLRWSREVWAALMRTLRSPGLPVRVARRSSVDDCSTLGLAAKTAPTLRAALERFVRYQWIWTGSPVMRVRDDPQRGAARVEVLPRGGFDLAGRCIQELIVANLLTFSREMAGPDVRPRCVHFAHSAPKCTHEHQAFFLCKIRFDSSHSGLDFDLETLARPLVHADAALSGFLLEHLESLAAGRRRPEALALEEQVRRAIREGLPGIPSMAQVAAGLATSSRTLRRRLLRAGSRYLDLRDEARRELARELLGTTDEPVAKIAARLGFSEPSAFYRALRRWTGGGPDRYRRRSEPRPEPARGAERRRQARARPRARSGRAAAGAAALRDLAP